MTSFVVDVFSVNSKNDIRKKRLEADTLESALKMIEVHSMAPYVMRIVISRRLGDSGHKVSKMKVWVRNMAS